MCWGIFPGSVCTGVLSGTLWPKSLHRRVEGSGWGKKLCWAPFGTGDGAGKLPWSCGTQTGWHTLSPPWQEGWEHNAQVPYCVQLHEPPLPATWEGGLPHMKMAFFVKLRCFSWINSSLATAFREQFSVLLTSHVICLFSQTFPDPELLSQVVGTFRFRSAVCGLASLQLFNRWLLCIGLSWTGRESSLQCWGRLRPGRGEWPDRAVMLVLLQASASSWQSIQSSAPAIPSLTVFKSLVLKNDWLLVKPPSNDPLYL